MLRSLIAIGTLSPGLVRRGHDSFEEGVLADVSVVLHVVVIL